MNSFSTHVLRVCVPSSSELQYSCSTMPEPNLSEYLEGKLLWGQVQDRTRRRTALQSSTTISFLCETKSTIFARPRYVCIGSEAFVHLTVLIRVFPLLLGCVWFDFAAYVLWDKPQLLWNSQSLITWILWSNSLESQCVSIIQNFFFLLWSVSKRPEGLCLACLSVLPSLPCTCKSTEPNNNLKSQE